MWKDMNRDKAPGKGFHYRRSSYGCCRDFRIHLLNVLIEKKISHCSNAPERRS